MIPHQEAHPAGMFPLPSPFLTSTLELISSWLSKQAPARAQDGCRLGGAGGVGSFLPELGFEAKLSLLPP